MRLFSPWAFVKPAPKPRLEDFIGSLEGLSAVAYAAMLVRE